MLTEEKYLVCDSEIKKKKFYTIDFKIRGWIMKQFHNKIHLVAALEIFVLLSYQIFKQSSINFETQNSMNWQWHVNNQDSFQTVATMPDEVPWYHKMMLKSAHGILTE